MKELAQLVDEEIGNEIYNLWLEYEKGETPESQLVKQIDKFEMALQAYQYEKSVYIYFFPDIWLTFKIYRSENQS